MTSVSLEDVKSLLRLEPHPREGGCYVRTWEAKETLPAEAFAHARYSGPRRTSTAIYYLLEPGTFSEMHRLKSDEVFHHYLGSPVEMLQLHADGGSARIVIGSDLAAGERPQVVVERGVWQGSRMLGGTGFALLGCTVSPGFEYEDYEQGTRAQLCAEWPEWSEIIAELTRV